MRVLISGASIAGPSLAYFLSRQGHEVTVVEHTAEVRLGGYPIDVRAGAMSVIEAMGLRPMLQKTHVDLQEIRFVDRAGVSRGRIDIRGLQAPSAHPDLEVPRGELIAALYGLSKGECRYVFGDSIATLAHDEAGVDVTFRKGTPRRFDLVVGADGLHSITRRLVFGDETQFARSIGGYCFVAADVTRDPRQAANSVLVHNVPGKLVSVYDYQERATALFAFPATPSREPEEQRALLRGAFSGGGWRVPELLEQVLRAPDFYFDSLTQIHMPAWSRGRVTLIGDAAHCSAFLSGQGSSLAILGAQTLATALGAGPDYAAVYERLHRPLVTKAQATVGAGRRMLIPQSQLGIWARDLFTRLSDLGVAWRRVRRAAA